jgi:hypothetical protein
MCPSSGAHFERELIRLYICLRTTITIPHTATYVCSYDYIYMSSYYYMTIYMSSYYYNYTTYCYICVLIRLYIYMSSYLVLLYAPSYSLDQRNYHELSRGHHLLMCVCVLLLPYTYTYIYILMLDTTICALTTY